MKRINKNKADYEYNNFSHWCDWGEEIDLKIYEKGNWISIESFMEGRIT